MNYPKFYDQVDKVRMYDPLAATLGSSVDGLFEYSFLDVVKFTGHGCPTVAGAYMCCLHVLRRLYKNDETPVRGQLKVHLRSLESEGANGVIGSVLTYLLGAAGAGGFKGLAGQFSRNYLIEYGVDQSCQIIIERLDTSRRVGIDYHPQHVPSDPNVSHLLKKVIDQTSSVEETKLLHDLWNTRVSKLLIDEKDNLNIYALSVF